MNPVQSDGFDGLPAAIDKGQDIPANEQVQRRETSPKPYVPERRSSKNSFKDNSRLFLIGAGIIAVLLIFVLGHIPQTSRPEIKKSSQKAATKEQPASIGSLTPIIEAIQPFPPSKRLSWRSKQRPTPSEIDLFIRYMYVMAGFKWPLDFR